MVVEQNREMRCNSSVRDDNALTSEALCRMRSSVAGLLSQRASLDLMSDVAARGTAAVEIVGKAIRQIKVLISASLNVDTRESNGRTALKEINELVESLIRGFSSVELPTNAEGRKCSDILAHYRSSKLDDDTELAKRFEMARAEYRKNPTDAAACVRFGWILHDCLKAAYSRLRNVKLTQFFKKEFEAWEYNGDPNKRNDALEEARARDIDGANRFLSGPRDALVFLTAGKWMEALAAGKKYLESNPGDGVAFDVCLKACEKLESLESGIDSFNLCQDAMRWHPENVFYQRSFVSSAFKILRVFRSTLRGANLNASVGAVRVYCSLINDVIANFGNLSAMVPGTSDYSSILLAVTTAMEGAFRFNVSQETVELLVATAKGYADFVCKWGLRNFRKKDCENYTDEAWRLSLAGRVSLSLIKCAEYGVDHAEDSWIMHFVLSSSKFFPRDPSRYLNALASLYYKDGAMDESRKYALKLVRFDPSAGWRWRVLARTYPAESQERQDCMGRAVSFRERVKALETHWSISRIFDEEGSRPRKMPEVERERGIKAIEEADRRADALLYQGAIDVDGVVLTCFKDNISKSDVVRVWWREPNTGLSSHDFIKLCDAVGMKNATPGMPVVLSISDTNGRWRVLRLAPRSNGGRWDIYPYAAGVLIERDDGRHFVKIMYGRGSVCSVSEKKLPDVANLKVADCCEVALFERDEMSPIVLDVRRSNNSSEDLDFCRSYYGVLRRVKGRRDGIVEDVVVTPAVRGDACFDGVVRGLAVDFKGHGTEPSVWKAITCETISQDLEVLQ